MRTVVGGLQMQIGEPGTPADELRYTPDVAELDSLEVVALVIVLREMRRELASAGDTAVVTEGLTSLLPLLLLSFFWTCGASLSGCVSMRAIRWPAKIALLWQSAVLAFSG